MSLYALTFSSLLALSLAQSTTVSLLIPNAGNLTGLVGSIAGQDSTATTFVVQCPPTATTAMPSTAAMTAAMITGTSGADDIDSEGDDEEGDMCPFLKPQTVVQGASTLHFIETAGDVSNTIDCQLMGTTQAVCTGTLSGVEPSADATESFPRVETATLSSTDLPPFIPVLITAGVSSSAGTSQTSASSAANTGTRGSSTGMSMTSGSTTATAANSQSTAGSAGGRSMEPALGVVAAGVMALGVVAAIL